MKWILQILLILLVVATTAICITKPNLHKNVIVYDSAYSLVPSEEVKTETKDIPIMEMLSKPVSVTISSEQKTNPVVKEVNYTTAKKQITTSPKVVQQKTEQKSTYQSNHQQKVSKQTEKVIPKMIENKTEVTQKPKTENTVQKQKVLTEQEEAIAWNIWRSNLQNKIMRDTKLPIIQNGIVFRFAFSVDKYGKISNLQTWSETPAYTPYAIQYIAPAIRNCQGHSILNFPEGSSRVTTDVKGGWRISSQERLSTPQDYNDIEKIRRTSY